MVMNGNFASTSDSNLVNGQTINVYGSSTYNTTYSLTGWSQCATNSGCPSGTTATGLGSAALGFLYTYGSQANHVSDSYGSNNFQLADSGAIPNTYPGACSTVTTGCGNYLAVDGGSSNNMAIYQSITNLTQGATYVLTFYTAAGQQSGYNQATTEDWKVYFGSSSQTTTTINNPAAGFTPWSLVTMIFTATTTTEDLEFLAQGTPVGGPPMDFLADINLVQTPEPAGLAVVGAGMLGLLAARRRWWKRG